jgi:16S rRNA G966 N2-methylase RsmD
LHTLEISKEAEILERDALAALRLLNTQSVAYDFIFLDPPYRKMDDYEQVLNFISQSRLLSSGGKVIAEHDKHFDPGESFGPLRRYRVLRQGDAVLSFYSAPERAAQTLS